MRDGTGAVVVVNYASSVLLRDNLRPLTGTEGHVVVVDNYSSAQEREEVTALAAACGWELVLAANDGFGAGMNAGVAAALDRGCTSLLLLNPDVTISPAVVQQLLRHAEQAPDDLVTPALLQADGSRGFAEGSLDLVRGTTRSRGPRDPSHERWLSGACLALSSRLWCRLDGFDERYFLYWEDIDLTHRCLALGGRLVVREDLQAVHAAGGTQGPGKSAAYFYYNCRNRLLFARTHLTRWQQTRWLLASPRYAWRVLLRTGRRAVLRRPGATLVPVLRGSLAGIALALTRRDHSDVRRRGPLGG